MKTPFSKLSKQEKRIVILKDALKHLKAEKISAVEGYVLITECDLRDHYGKELQDILKNEKQCQVCARGALLFSMVWRNDNFTISRDLDLWGIGNKIRGCAGENRDDDIFLKKLFPEKQLKMMERSFEGRYHSPTDLFVANPLDADASTACTSFYRKYETPHQRMEAILKNAIKNKGTFKP